MSAEARQQFWEKKDQLATEVFVRRERLRPRLFGRAKQAHNSAPPPSRNTEVSPPAATFAASHNSAFLI